jgi:hypothetical protein
VSVRRPDEYHCKRGEPFSIGKLHFGWLKTISASRRHRHLTQAALTESHLTISALP